MNAGFEFLKDFKIYNPEMNVWDDITYTMTGPRPPSLVNFGMTSTQDAKIYVFGGNQQGISIYCFQLF
jgi:hypothetical protein